MAKDLLEEAVKEIPQPFVHTVEFSKWEKIKLWIMTFTVFPIRFVIMITLMLTAWSLTSIGLLGISKTKFQEKPISGWRKFIKGCEKYLSHLFFFIAGFHNIKIIGKKAHSSEAPIVCVAPHSSFFDTLVEFAGGVFCPVVREQSSSTAIISTLINYTQPVYVKRDDPLSRQYTIQEIRRRAYSGDNWEQILIFPEGTCTNRKCLIYFKSGAFLPGVPIQPVCLRYPNKNDTVTWTWDGPGALKVMWLVMTQFHQQCEIEFLPVYTPNETEKQDPRLFADNVRNLMAKKLGVPTCDISYDDIKYEIWAKERNLLHTVGLIKLLKLRRKLNFEKIEIKDELPERLQDLKSYGKSVSCKEFANFLKVPLSEVLQDFFDAIDNCRSGFMDPRSYVAGLWILRQDMEFKEKMLNAFETFCTKKDAMNLIEFTNYMWLIKGISSSWSSKIFKELKKDDSVIFDDLWNILTDGKNFTNGIHSHTNGLVVSESGSISASVCKCKEEHQQNGKKRI